MKFSHPGWLWILLLIPVVAGLIWYDERLRLKRFELFANKVLWPRIAPEFSPQSRWRKSIVLLLSFVFILLALARPQLGTREETVQVKGLDIVIALDLSNSMLVEDVIPNRLKKAKHWIRSLIDRLGGDRIGIVSFAESSYLACPLTTDLTYVLDVLEILGPKSIQNQGTDIGRALETAYRAVERGAEDTGAVSAEAEGASKAVILISDGEDHEKHAADVANKIKEGGIRLFVLGVGTRKGGPIPIKDEAGNTQAYKRDKSSQPVISAFDSGFLSNLAKNSGGKYWDISEDESEINEILGELGALSRKDYAERSYRVYDERFQWPLFIAILLLILELSIPARRILKNQALLIMVLLFGILESSKASAGLKTNPAASWDAYSENQRGIEAFQQGNLEEAEKNFGAAQARDPSQTELEFNQGVVHLQQQNPDKAIQSFSRAAQDAGNKKNDKLLGKSLYNLGNAFVQKGDIAGAIHSYLGAINTTAKSKDETLENQARKNLQLLLNEMKKKQEKEQEEKNQAQNQSQNASGESSEDGKSQQQEKKSESSESKDQKQNKGEDGAREQKRYTQGKKQKFESKKLSPEDAERVMSELTTREKNLQEKLQAKHGNQSTATKDW